MRALLACLAVCLALSAAVAQDQAVTLRYQFTPGQTFALLPQLAETTPFFLSMSQAQKLSGPYTVSLLASAFLSGNIIFFK